MRPSLVVSVHDVAPLTAAATRSWATELDRRDVPATYLAVPGPWEGPPLGHDPALVDWLHARIAQSDEVALHGWTHRPVDGGTIWRRVAGTVAARGRAEFFGLDERETRRRLELGVEALHASGFDPVGFTPPGWLASPATGPVLRELGFRYWTSHRAVHDLVTGTRHPVFALSHRPGGASEPIAARVVDAWSRRLARDGRSVRVALHPADLASPQLVEVTLAIIDRVIAAGAEPRTYQHLVESALARAA